MLKYAKLIYKMFDTLRWLGDREVQGYLRIGRRREPIGLRGKETDEGDDRLLLYVHTYSILRVT